MPGPLTFKKLCAFLFYVEKSHSYTAIFNKRKVFLMAEVTFLADINTNY